MKAKPEIVKHEEEFDNYFNVVKDISKFSEAPSVGDSPFLPSLGGQIIVKDKIVGAENKITSFDMVDPVTGEIGSKASENRIFTRKQEVDSDKFIKLYAGRLQLMFDLTSTGLNVFVYFLHEIQKKHNIDRDLIYFNVQDCIKFCDYKSSNSVYRGLTELISVGFIAKAKEPINHFYIDPTTAFNGNRIVIWEEYVKKQQDYFTGPKKELEEEKWNQQN